MDEAVINGANLFFADQFGIGTKSPGDAGRNQWLLGLVNAAPYVSLVFMTEASVDFLLPIKVSLLCLCRMLAHGPTEPLLWSSWNHFHHRNLLFPHLYLARRHQLMGTPLRCTVLPWTRYWSEVRYRSRLCCRMCTSGHSWRSGHDVADVDGVWNHAGICRRPGVLQSPEQASYHRPELEIDVSLCKFPTPPLSARK